MQFHELSESEVTFSLECEQECDAPDDHFCEQEDSQWVREQLDQGNEWAWFCAKVTAKWNDRTGTAYLGGCSYASEDEFRADAYFSVLQAEALADLNRSLAHEWALLSSRVR